MKKILKNKATALTTIVALMLNFMPFGMKAQTIITPQPIKILSTKEVQQKVQILNTAVKQMKSAKTRMIAELVARIALGAVFITAIAVAITAATGGAGIGLMALIEGTSIASLGAAALAPVGIGVVAGGAALAVGSIANLSRAIAYSVIFKTLGEAIINQKPLAFLLFTLPTRNAFRKLDGLDQKQKELNELLAFEKNNPGTLDKKQQKIIASYQQKLKDPFYVGAFKAFAERNLMVETIIKAGELDNSIKTIIKNDAKKTAKMIAKYILLNRNFDNYMSALKEQTIDKKGRTIFSLRGLARTKVGLQFKITGKQITKIEKKYPQFVILKNELIGIYKEESKAIDEKYNEMLKK